MNIRTLMVQACSPHDACLLCPIATAAHTDAMPLSANIAAVYPESLGHPIVYPITCFLKSYCTCGIQGAGGVYACSCSSYSTVPSSSSPRSWYSTCARARMFVHAWGVYTCAHTCAPAHTRAHIVRWQACRSSPKFHRSARCGSAVF